MMIQLDLRGRAPFALSLTTAALLVAAVPALAQGTPEQREACTPDAISLCQDTIPDVEKTTACMQAHEAELSPRCRAFFAPPPVSEPRPETRAEQDPTPDDEPVLRPHHPYVAPQDDDAAADDNADLHHARMVLGHLCNSQMIDASTCAFTDRMMNLAR